LHFGRQHILFDKNNNLLKIKSKVTQTKKYQFVQ